jgi:hypothetical protein
MARMLDRSDPSYLHPDWTTEEVSRLVEHWRSLESAPKARCRNPKESQGSLDKQLAGQFPRQSSRARSHRAISKKRANLYEAIRFAGTFNEMQTFSGERVWFDLTEKEQSEVEVPTRVRKTLSTLTRESYNTLVKMKSVRKWTKVRKALSPKPKTPVTEDSRHSSKCRSCWSAAEVKQLVSTWGLVLSTSNTSIRTFERQDYDASARLYAPWNRSTLSSWRKMKRIAASYLFIRAFDEQQAPRQWFQLSDGAQNLHIDWSNLPPDFEDIGRDVFGQIQRLDASLSSASSPARGTSDLERSKPIVKEPGEAIEALNRDIKSSSSLRGDPDRPRPANSVETVALPPPPSHGEPRKASPRLRYPSPPTAHKGAKRTRDIHGECIAFYNHMEQHHKNQVTQAIQRLKADLQRDTELGADTVRTIFFERLGTPGQNGDAAFVSNLLKEQQRQVRVRLDQFQREHCANVVHNEFVFGPR